ncbi:hypothetical protein ACFT5B_09655 [Luteimicrobium sp. NPDC057192]|uniref:hypothetical protein n=1 Tax=Luteimicrobium sp. NPDC057192 TaxID=3346042 RepID=UPI0036272115
MPTDDPALAPVLALGPTTPWEAARDLLLAGGWTLAGTGDWAWVWRSPSRRHAARISPFDPAAPRTPLPSTRPRRVRAGSRATRVSCRSTAARRSS